MANFYMGVLPFAGIVLWLTSRRAYGHRFMVLGIMFAVMTLYDLGKYTRSLACSITPCPAFRCSGDRRIRSFSWARWEPSSQASAWITSFRRGEEISRASLVALGGIATFAFVAAIGMAIWLGKLQQSGADILIALGFVLATFAVVIAIRSDCAASPGGRRDGARCAHVRRFRLEHASQRFPPACPHREYDAMRLDETENDTILALKKHIVTDATRRDRVEIAGLGFHWPNLGLVHGFENTLGYNPLRLKHYSTATGAGDQVAASSSTISRRSSRPIARPSRTSWACASSPIGAPIAQVDSAPGANPLPLVARTKDAYIYENPDALPRVMVG